MNDATQNDAGVTLTLRNPPKDGPTIRSAVAFGEDGGNIGRGAGSDWVLDASGVSRMHASIRCIDGTYFVEDHSTNGVLHNGAPLRRGVPATLRDGDTLQIDVFQIGVALASAGVSETSRPQDGQAGVTSMPATSHDSPGQGDGLDEAFDLVKSTGNDGGDAFDVLATPSGEARAKVDPLAMFATDFSFAESGDDAVPSDMPWNHGAASGAAYRALEPAARPSNASLLPENWDSTRSEFERVPLTASSPKVAPATVEPAAERATRAVAGKDSADGSQQPAAAARVADGDSTSSFPAGALTGEDVTPTPAPDNVAVRAEFAPSEPVATSSSATAGASPARDAAPAPLSGALPASQADQLLLSLVAGVMDVLHARAELKNSLRMPVTLIQRTENNPLKFAPTAEEAIKRLLGDPDPAYLTGMDAVEDARRDIARHHMAMLAGMRAAFENVFAQFAPARFDQEGERDSRVFGLRRANGPWKRYTDYYNSLLNDEDERFRRLFGEEFAHAYEEQMARARSAARPDRTA